MIKAAVGVLPAIIDALRDKVVGEAEVPAMAGLPMVQAMARVFSITVKLLAGKVARETAGEVGVHAEATTPVAASPRMSCLAGILPTMIKDSSSRLQAPRLC